ncbi:glycosyltransferase family 4 protein [Luteimonas mephitis]|uniref:glycosyltransferase family 4 protein n=1 Tax=Luteimonas mephitis TaxID=83615 RepID=UPI003A903CF9
MERGGSPAVWLPTIRAGTGADVFVRRLCDGLNARGIRAGITWLPHRAEYLPWTVPVQQPPDWANIAHVNSWLPKRFWPQNLPAVATVHHLVHDPAYRPFRSSAQAAYHELVIRPRELRAIREADAVTTVSDYVRRTVVAFSGREDIAMIHNWIDTTAFSPAEAGDERKAGPFRLFMAGSRTRRKGIDLLPAFVDALGSGFEVRYAGAPVDPRAPMADVVELGRISEDALIREYRECDAVVSLSRYEGFGYTALEAMACGKPFLGFRTSALPEVVAECEGVLVPVDDVRALAAATVSVKQRLEQTGDVQMLGRDTVLRRFSSSNLDAYIALYRELLSRTSANQRGSHDEA